MNEATCILSAIDQGDSRAAERLLPLVHGEHRKPSARRIANEKSGQTLWATALVHEAHLRLVGADGGRHRDGHGHFLAAAAEAMRRILVDNARRERTEKHGTGHRRQDLDEVEVAAGAPAEDLLALDEALGRLAAEDPAKGELVKLRYFAGLSIEDTAGAADPGAPEVGAGGPVLPRREAAPEADGVPAPDLSAYTTLATGAGALSRSEVLRKHRLKKALKLPTMTAECEKVAVRCAKENVDHPGFLLQFCELELIERERHAAGRSRRGSPRPRP